MQNLNDFPFWSHQRPQYATAPLRLKASSLVASSLKKLTERFTATSLRSPLSLRPSPRLLHLPVAALLHATRFAARVAACLSPLKTPKELLSLTEIQCYGAGASTAQRLRTTARTSDVVTFWLRVARSPVTTRRFAANIQTSPCCRMQNAQAVRGFGACLARHASSKGRASAKYLRALLKCSCSSGTSQESRVFGCRHRRPSVQVSYSARAKNDPTKLHVSQTATTSNSSYLATYKQILVINPCNSTQVHSPCILYLALLVRQSVVLQHPHTCACRVSDHEAAPRRRRR